MEALLKDPTLARTFTGKAVFVGVTAVTEVKDRLMTPVGSHRTTGIEINAGIQVVAQPHYYGRFRIMGGGL